MFEVYFFVSFLLVRSCLIAKDAVRTKPHAICAEPHTVRQTVAGTRATAVCTIRCNDSEGVLLDKPS